MRWDIVIDDAVDSGDIESTTGDVGSDEDGPSAGFELVQCAESGGLGELTVERDGGEGEETEEDREALSVEDGSDEDDEGLAGEGVREVDEVEVLVLHWDEEVVLEEGRDGLVPAECRASVGTRERTGETHLEETSSLTGSRREARWSLATLVVIVAEKRYVWRCSLGMTLRMLSMTGPKSRSSKRSASSMTCVVRQLPLPLQASSNARGT